MTVYMIPLSIQVDQISLSFNIILSHNYHQTKSSSFPTKKVMGFTLMAAVAVAFAFYCCTVSGPADVQDQSIHHFYLPGYSGCYQENHKSPIQEYWTCMQRRKREHEEQKAWMMLLKKVILSVVQYICIAGLMNVFIIKPILHVYVSSFVTQTICAFYLNTIKATFTVKAKESRKVYRWWFNSSCSYQSLFPLTIYACDQNTIKTTMDHPSFTNKTKKRQMVYNCWWYNRSNNTSQIQDLSPDRC